MANTTEKAIIKTLAPYLMAFPQSKMNEASLVIYARALSGLSLAEIDAAMLKLMRTCKFFPTVAEIIEQAENMSLYATGQELPTPDEAWHEAMQLVKRCHVYKPWEFSCPEVEKAVQHFGKMELCTLEVDDVNTARAQFMRIYTSVLGRAKEQRHNEAVLQSLPAKQREVLKLTNNLTNTLAKDKAVPMLDMGGFSFAKGKEN